MVIYSCLLSGPSCSSIRQSDFGVHGGCSASSYGDGTCDLQCRTEVVLVRCHSLVTSPVISSVTLQVHEPVVYSCYSLSLQLPSSGCSFGLSGDFSSGFPLRLFCSFLLDWPLLRSLPLISLWHILRSLLSHIAWPLPGISSWPVLRSFYWPVAWTALMDANLLYWFWWWRCVQLDWNKSRGAFNLWHMYWSSRCGGFVVKKVVVVDRVL